MTVIENLAGWAAQPHEFGPVAIDVAKHSIEDYFACLLAGSDSEAAVAARESVRPWTGHGKAHAVGLPPTSSPMAALVNGTAAHGLDFDDLAVEAANHPAAVMLPGLLAIAQERGYTGAQVLDAYIIGLELNNRIASGVMRSHSTIGWHTTSTLGAIAAAAANASLLGLDANGLAHAVSLGVSFASGLKGQFGSIAKPLHAGIAAQHGVQAATLAACGMQGRLDILESPLGFRNLYGGGETPGWDDRAAQIGDSLLIEQWGLATKRFPCCGAAHRSLDCLLELRMEHRFAAEDVASIDATVGLLNYRNLRYTDPQTPTEAKFSMQYCMAVALYSGNVMLRDFTVSAIRRPEIRGLFDLTALHHHPADAAPSAESAAPAHEVVVRLKDGTRLFKSRKYQVGSMREPLSEHDRQTKFIECAAQYMDAAAAKSLRRQLSDFERCTDVGALVEIVCTQEILGS